MKNLIPVYIYIAITYLFHIGVAMDKLNPKLRSTSAYWLNDGDTRTEIITSAIFAPVTVPIMIGAEFSRAVRER